ncbi:MAG: polymer-forming cytoskeletal protein [Acidobacteriota bacterium]
MSAIIGSSIVIKGELLGDEEIVIEGRVEGKIHIKNNLIVGQKGSVEADIVAHGVIINGRVHGNIVADRVEIVASGSLEGNIKAPKISIADGAHFKGSVDMGHSEAPAAPAPRPAAAVAHPAPQPVPRPAAPVVPANPNPSLKL